MPFFISAIPNSKIHIIKHKENGFPEYPVKINFQIADYMILANWNGRLTS